MAVIKGPIPKAPDAPVKTEVPNEQKPLFRYVCESCTGIAGVSIYPDAIKDMTCKVCGKGQKVKKGSWIKI